MVPEVVLRAINLVREHRTAIEAVANELIAAGVPGEMDGAKVAEIVLTHTRTP